MTDFGWSQHLETQEFRAAITQFKQDIPHLIASRRHLISQQDFSPAYNPKAADNEIYVYKSGILPYYIAQLNIVYSGFSNHRIYERFGIFTKLKL